MTDMIVHCQQGTVGRGDTIFRRRDGGVVRIWQGGEVVYDVRARQPAESDADYTRRVEMTAQYSAICVRYFVETRQPVGELKMNDFKFDIGVRAKITESGESGQIIARTESMSYSNRYQLRYAQSGKCVEEWWDENALEVADVTS